MGYWREAIRSVQPMFTWVASEIKFKKADVPIDNLPINIMHVLCSN